MAQNPCSQFWMRILAHSLGIEPLLCLHLWLITLDQNPGSQMSIRTLLCLHLWIRTLAHSLGLEPLLCLHLWIRTLAHKQTLNQNPGLEHLHTTYNPNSELSTVDQDSGSQTKELPVNGLKGFNAEKDKHESFADVTVCLSVFR